MAALVCDICGGKLTGKPGGIFCCEVCGMEYSTEWAREKLGVQSPAPSAPAPVAIQEPAPARVDIDKLLKQGWAALENGENWAGERFRKVLDEEPECGDAHLGLFCVAMELKKPEDILKLKSLAYLETDAYKRALRYAAYGVRCDLESWERQLRDQLEQVTKNAAPLRRKARELRKLIVHYDKGVAAVSVSGKGFCTDNIMGAGPFEAVFPAWHIRGGFYVVLRDGSVRAVGKVGSEEYKHWNRPVQIVQGDNLTVAVFRDGTVKYDYDAEKIWWPEHLGELHSWQDIVQVQIPASTDGASTNTVVGLRKDGTVMVSAKYGACKELSEWKDVDVMPYFYCGIQKDGTMLHSHLWKEAPFVGRKDVLDIARVYSGYAVLWADGTVSIVSKGSWCEKRIENWKNIVAISTNSGAGLVGLTKDGRVLVNDQNTDTSGWKLFEDADKVEEEMEEARKKAVKAAERRQRESEKRRKELNDKLSLLRLKRNSCGFFEGKRKKELDAEIEKVQAELNRL